MDAFVTFEPALAKGEIAVQRGEIDRDVYVHMDHPAGEVRYTYVRLKGKKVTAMAMIIPAEPYENKHCFQIGYAVPVKFRGQGRAKDIARAAIAELTNGLKSNGLKSFYIEAIVGADNAASQHVAAAIVGGKTRIVTDDHSGQPALQYMAKVET